MLPLQRKRHIDIWVLTVSMFKSLLSHQMMNSVPAACRRLSIGRTILYRALNSDPAYRKGFPHLRSVAVGGRRLIPEAALHEFAAALEASSSE